MIDKQVNAEAYNFKRYVHLERWISIHYQLTEVFSFKPKTVLEVGLGPGVFKDAIIRSKSIKYTSIDIAEDLNPDVVGSVTELPFDDRTFDVVCAFQVLEHMPYKMFEKSVSEMMRVSRKGIVISLPHYGPNIQFLFKFPMIKRLRGACKFTLSKKHEFDGQHYWEIGKKGYSVNKVKKVLSTYGNLNKDYIPFENRYHHFFVVLKK